MKAHGSILGKHPEPENEVPESMEMALVKK